MQGFRRGITDIFCRNKYDEYGNIFADVYVRFHHRAGIIRRGLRIVVVTLAISMIPQLGVSQTEPVVEGTNIRPFTLSGNVGFVSEGYSASGVNNRRPPASLRVFANTSFSVFGIRSGLQLRYSTESSQLRQSMNRLSFSGRWKWISLSAGRVSPSLTSYSLSGTSFDGAFLELTPGKWSLAFTGGRAQRAVGPSEEEGFRRAAYERWLYAGRVGYGQSGGTYFHLNVMYARDDTSSLTNPGSVSPEENLNVTPDFGFALFDNRFEMNIHTTVSAYTRDSRAREVSLDESPVPSGFENVYTPRIGTRVDYAGEATARLNLDVFRMSAVYSRVQPGFRSLGTSRTRSDQEQFRLNPQLSLLNNRLEFGVNYSTERNNLLGNRITTQQSNNIGITARGRISSAFSLSGSYNRRVNETTAEEETPAASRLEQTQRSGVYTLQPSITLITGGYSHSVSLSGSYETMTNEFAADTAGATRSRDFTNINTTLNYGLTFPSGFNMNLSGNFLRSKTGNTRNSNFGVNAGTGLGFFQQKLRVQLNLGFSQNSVTPVNGAVGSERESRQFSVNANASYRIFAGDVIRLTLRNTNNRQVSGSGNTFREFQARLRYQHQF